MESHTEQHEEEQREDEVGAAHGSTASPAGVAQQIHVDFQPQVEDVPADGQDIQK